MGRYGILQLITRADWGGAQRHVFDLATHLCDQRFEVTVACAPDGVLVDRLRAKNIRVMPIAAFHPGISLIRDAAALAQLRNVISTVRPALVHSHSSKAGILGRLAAHEVGIPSVYTAHGFAFGGQASSPLVRATYLAAEWWAGRFWTDYMITVSEADRKLALLRKIVRPDRVITVHNGIDWARYAHIPLPSVAARIPVVGVISRLVAGKGLEDLIDAAAILISRKPCRFVIAGDGPLRPALQGRTKRLGLDASITFPGFVDPETALKELDVLVLPSRKEGLPYNVLEAMAAGRPVVATRVGGLSEIITDGENGRLVPVADIVSLADAIDELTSEPRLTDLGCAARKTVQQRFSQDRMVTEICRVYEGLL